MDTPMVDDDSFLYHSNKTDALVESMAESFSGDIEQLIAELEDKILEVYWMSGGNDPPCDILTQCKALNDAPDGGRVCARTTTTTNGGRGGGDCSYLPMGDNVEICGENNDNDKARCILSRMRLELKEQQQASSAGGAVPRWCQIAAVILRNLMEAVSVYWVRLRRGTGPPRIPDRFATIRLDASMVERLYRDTRACLRKELTWSEWCYWLTIYWHFIVRHPQLNRPKAIGMRTLAAAEARDVMCDQPECASSRFRSPCVRCHHQRLIRMLTAFYKTREGYAASVYVAFTNAVEESRAAERTPMPVPPQSHSHSPGEGAQNALLDTLWFRHVHGTETHSIILDDAFNETTENQPGAYIEAARVDLYLYCALHWYTSVPFVSRAQLFPTSVWSSVMTGHTDPVLLGALREAKKTCRYVLLPYLHGHNSHFRLLVVVVSDGTALLWDSLFDDAYRIPDRIWTVLEDSGLCPNATTRRRHTPMSSHQQRPKLNDCALFVLRTTEYLYSNPNIWVLHSDPRSIDVRGALREWETQTEVDTRRVEFCDFTDTVVRHIRRLMQYRFAATGLMLRSGVST